MFSIVFRDLIIFVTALIGLALPAWCWLGWSRGVERVALAVAAGLIAGYLALFGLYATGESLRWFWVLPAFGIPYGLVRAGRAADLWREAAVRGLLGRWLLLSFWCVGWQGLVVSYSGGGWAADWVEHYDRAHFFLQRWPGGFLFLGMYPLPARPPLVNLWMAGLMSQTGGGFAHYQVLSTLFSTLVIFPLAVLLERWRADSRARNLAFVLLMLCPMFVQNATFPWTKLGAAFFVLLAITQLAPDAGSPTVARLGAGALLLAGGMLAHYSTGVWICGLGAAGLWFHRDRWRTPDFQRHLMIASTLAGLLLATWLVWAVAVYGPTVTFTANSMMSLAPAGTLAERALRAAGNLWYTLVPTVANTDGLLLRQSSPLGQWRDHWFLLFQLRLPFTFGSAGFAVMLWQFSRVKWCPETAYWLIAVPVIIVLGAATCSQADILGLAHICLQPLVLLGLAWLAVRADRLPRWLARVWMVGLALDFSLGILLHFAVQSLWLERWWRPGLSSMQHLAAYNPPARANLKSKLNLNLTFLGDLVTPAACATLLVAVGLIATRICRRPHKLPRA